jgi:subtilisin family serine protease
MRSTRMLVSALTASAVLAAPAAASPAGSGVLVTAAGRAALPGEPSFVTQLSPGLRVYLLRPPAGMRASAYADKLAMRPGVFATQVDRRMKVTALSKGCADVPSVNQSQTLVNAVAAGAIVAPATTRPIAILDTGVDPDTTELRGRVLPGLNTTTGSGDTSDIDGHGTEVAAVAAASGGRFQGISPTSPILPIKIYTISSETTAAWVVRGIGEAVARGAGVINLSSSTKASDTPSSDAGVLDQAITAAFAQGTITVVAAGEEGKGDASVPADLTRVLTVGSASAEGTRDAFSNYGPWIDLVSPGANLTLPAPFDVCESGYGIGSGTSFSAPAVAGAAALIWSRRPALNAQGIYDVMRMGAVKDLYDRGRDDDSGFGLLDVAAGVNSATPIKQTHEVDDDVYWLKQDPKNHPTYLKKTRNVKLKSAVEEGKDPQDVYPVYLRRGQTLTVTATATGGNLGVGIWRPGTGSFDIGKGRTTYLLADANGITTSPRASAPITRTGTYYVSVEAPDLPDPSDPQTAGNTISAQTKYTLTLHATKAPAARKKKRKKKP